LGTAGKAALVTRDEGIRADFDLSNIRLCAEGGWVNQAITMVVLAYWAFRLDGIAIVDNTRVAGIQRVYLEEARCTINSRGEHAHVQGSWGVTTIDNHQLNNRKVFGTQRHPERQSHHAGDS
jgi:hypothetical protein